MDCFFRIVRFGRADKIIVKVCRIDLSSVAAASVDNKKIARSGTPDNGQNLFGHICGNIIVRVELSVRLMELVVDDDWRAYFYRDLRSVRGDIFALLF